MILIDQNGDEIEVVSVYGEYEDFIEIDEAYYVNKVDDIPDEVLDFLNSNYAAEIYELWYEQKVGNSELLYDIYREGAI